jgi:ribosomal protein S18 acetylase RimI-like enzyme
MKTKCSRNMSSLHLCKDLVVLPDVRRSVLCAVTNPHFNPLKRSFCFPQDRQLMGLVSPVLDHDLVGYILTLGVLEGFRHQGIAASLIQMSCHQAAAIR